MCTCRATYETSTVISEQLEAKGHTLAETMAEYVFTCFQSRDPQVTPEVVVHRPITKTEEATRASVQDMVKLVVVRFQCLAEDTSGSQLQLCNR
jgi:hypothetical protein